MSATSLNAGDVRETGNAGNAISGDGPFREARLDESRRELRELFAPEENVGRPDTDFPRSKLMRTLTGSGGLMLLAVGASGLLLAKPKLLRHVVRIIPLGSIFRMAAVRFMSRRL